MIHLRFDFSLPIDYEVAAKYADVFHRLVVAVANTTSRPLWYDDSLFGNRFAPDQQKAQKGASELAIP